MFSVVHSTPFKDKTFISPFLPHAGNIKRENKATAIKVTTEKLISFIRFFIFLQIFLTGTPMFPVVFRIRRAKNRYFCNTCNLHFHYITQSSNSVNSFFLKILPKKISPRKIALRSPMHLDDINFSRNFFPGALTKQAFRTKKRPRFAKPLPQRQSKKDGPKPA
ncbi:MAG: hypothetical protein LUD29_05155 [Clostridia bacterium]|nr:hypothetical protein [Clostridia bacterium]